MIEKKENNKYKRNQRRIKKKRKIKCTKKYEQIIKKFSKKKIILGKIK